ncbi:MAG: glycerol-3-phosphate 1-O-acyltransferase [Clostridia bacterium]|nr:glycerol-3-phosphate 1-O-acyltransferase [Clostridia bacterium]
MEYYLLIAAGIVAAFLIGSIPSAVWIGKIFYGIDVRTEGSGNAGATNTIRVLGAKAGIPVLLFDIFKGWLAVHIAVYFAPEGMSELAMIHFRIALAAVAVLGHVFPIFAGFRGGKGIATLLGVGIALYPQAVLVAIIVFAIVLAITGYVSLGSITASVTFPFVVIIFFNPHSLSLLLLAVMAGIFVPLTHHHNVERLLKGTERKFSFRKRKTPQ